MLESLIAWDKELFSLINTQWCNGFLDLVLPYWRTKTTWIPLYILLFLIIGKDRGFKIFWVLIVLGLTIALADQISSEWIKKIVERVRPCNDSSLPNVRTLIHCGSGFSFTSSHATNHFALVMQLFLIFRMTWKTRYFVALFIWAALIAYAQVYVGVHYPLDVLAGGLVGCILAWLVHQISAWLGITRKIWS
ncbi:MAG: membrane-associated phospholipid phosphatase [Aureispira sp.]|jgi:membrane-associated phospholipid phosphatase